MTWIFSDKQYIFIVDDYIEIALGEAFSKANCKTLIAKDWDYAIERREALKLLESKEQDDDLIWYNKEKYSNYWLLKKD